MVWATSLTLVLVKNEPSCFFTLFAYLHSSDVEEWPRCIFLIRKTPESWGTDFCSVGLCSDKREKALWKIVCWVRNVEIKYLTRSYYSFACLSCMHLLYFLFKVRKSFLSYNKTIWGPLELVEKLYPEAEEIGASVRDLPGLK